MKYHVVNIKHKCIIKNNEIAIGKINNMANQSTNFYSMSLEYLKLTNNDDNNNNINIDNNNRNNNNNNHDSNNNFNISSYEFTNGGGGVGNVASGFDNSNNNSTIVGTAAFSLSTHATFNQTHQYQIDNVVHNNNDSVKSNFEAGSNFMLLLEDFGEYFYNYNNSGGGTGINSNSSVGFEFQTNCSIANSTCAEHSGKCIEYCV